MSIHQRVGMAGVDQAPMASLYFIQQECQIKELVLFTLTLFCFVFLNAKTENIRVFDMTSIPGGLTSECLGGATRWWLQRGEPPAHESAAPTIHSRGSSLHAVNIFTQSNSRHTYKNSVTITTHVFNASSPMAFIKGLTTLFLPQGTNVYLSN